MPISVHLVTYFGILRLLVSIFEHSVHSLNHWFKTIDQMRKSYLWPHANSFTTGPDIRDLLRRRPHPQSHRHSRSRKHSRNAHFAYFALPQDCQTRTNSWSKRFLFEAACVFLFATGNWAYACRWRCKKSMASATFALHCDYRHHDGSYRLDRSTVKQKN